MQFLLVENARMDALTVEDGNITLHGTPIMRMGGLSFASGNPDFQRMSRRLAELPSLVEKARLRAAKYPDDEGLRDDLQRLLDERNGLREEFDRQQSLLLETAKRIAQLQGEQASDRMRRAIDAFERGDVREANVILDEAEHDARRNLMDYRRNRDATEQSRRNVIQSIEELLLKTSTLMADGSTGIEERVGRVAGLYADADEMAAEIGYDKEKYAQLLSDYAEFLNRYGRYEESLTVHLKTVSFHEDLYGKNHPETATAYNNIGLVYQAMGDPARALEYYRKALAIDRWYAWLGSSGVAAEYINIGAAYVDLGDYPRALKYYRKVLAMQERTLGEGHPNRATSYNNIGMVYFKSGDYSRALAFLEKGLTINEKVFGENHPNTAASYNNVGLVYEELCDYPHALQSYGKALEIQRHVLGEEHPDTANSYNNIGMAYLELGQFSRAREYFEKALAINGHVPDAEISRHES